MPALPLLLSLFLFLFAGQAFSASALIPQPPDISARGYLLMDYDSGQILAQNNIDQRLEPASLTKMMSAYVVAHEIASGKIGLDDQVLISEKAWRMQGSRMFVEVGKRVSVRELLKGVIIQSGNDATVALAEYVAGSEESFASLMNQHAQRMGMTGTHFVNSTGLPDPEHYTTPRDLALLARSLIHDFPEDYEWYSIKQFTYNNIPQYNRNKLLWRNKLVDGIKTGHTESAGFCLVASALSEGMRVISVVLGTNSEEQRAQESQKLLTYGFRFFETHKLYSANEPLTTARIWKGESDNLPLGLQEDLYVTIPRGQYDKLAADMNIQARIIAPAQVGDTLGTVNVRLNGETYAERDLHALANVPSGGLFSKLVDEVKLMFE